ncbi:hypothetical protein PBCV1_A551bL [Paramecium bursaria Chlorella virus 1]|uniref:Uncharacterized protein n=1 Tax=Paramecium bursaria Chlorella virus 1 TaxID=10506 RepID=F8TU57_PBCV1|nr:hypothetical protein PBCV1_A551bL [Paramecium bursaria Chlorella virus 1]AEI70118.1 hypothetical protein [Paramecium bursaria Chlorella virus 1]
MSDFVNHTFRNIRFNKFSGNIAEINKSVDECFFTFFSVHFKFKFSMYYLFYIIMC